ncbi:hypothetical protein AC579_3066 [Pseudocercospora musae]|uniref:Uncharacterized protein n=1 Tax=Pseudocercospora musae TaxID=113226 RepID=A0A139IJJ5_9PEZI|nr:hypothetical protein AC579_3066 [Pseudocercospora musae]
MIAIEGKLEHVKAPIQEVNTAAHPPSHMNIACYNGPTSFKCGWIKQSSRIRLGKTVGLPSVTRAEGDWRGVDLFSAHAKMGESKSRASARLPWD